MTTRHSEVVVVGAGITGLSVALHLAEAGVKPLVLEREGVAAGASGVQPGGVRQQWSTPLNCLLARESAAFFADLPSRLDSTLPLGFSQCGYAFLAHSEERLAQLAEAVSVQNAAGIPSTLLSADEAAATVTGLATDGLAGASWCSEDGYFDRPQSVVEAFAQAAWARGAELLVADVVSISPDGDGWTLALRDGSSIVTGRVVLAAGCDTSALAATAGIDLPIEREARHLFYSEPIAERILEPLVVAPERHFAAKQLADGRILASDLSAVGDPEAGRAEWLGNVRRAATDLLPRLTYVSFSILVTGFYDVTPDNQPVLGSVEGLPGLQLAAGFSGHGFMLAPAVGRRIADAVLGDGADEALEKFSLARFARGALQREFVTV
ncbi:MAG TPA: FAD-binding oxidoreductase [Gaiellaceae bacterium]|jgi:sarcosine oxidase subunit beta|nr:FAD-binding oxidoreductase [Gaiellaceae bacterium]